MRPRKQQRTPEDVGAVVSRIGTDTVSYNGRWLIHIGLDIGPACIYACPYIYTPLVYRPYGHIGKIQIPLANIPGLKQWRPRHYDAVSKQRKIQAAHAAAAAQVYQQALAAMPLWRKREALNYYMRRRRRVAGNLTQAEMEKMRATGRPSEFGLMTMEDVDFWFDYMQHFAERMNE